MVGDSPPPKTVCSFTRKEIERVRPVPKVLTGISQLSPFTTILIALLPPLAAVVQMYEHHFLSQ